MIEIDGVPLVFKYGERAAPVFGYDKHVDAAPGTDWWLQQWFNPKTRKHRQDLYIPEIIASRSMLIIQTIASSIKLYLIDEMTITCLMRGFPWEPERIDALAKAWTDLPYSAYVTTLVREKASWLDENPGYRGIPVKQSKTEERKLGARDV